MAAEEIIQEFEYMAKRYNELSYNQLTDDVLKLRIKINAVITDLACMLLEKEYKQNVDKANNHQYVQDNSTAMNCAICGKSKWVHPI